MLARGETSLGGRLPVSTNGGLLSRGHPRGAAGIAQAMEVVTRCAAKPVRCWSRGRGSD
jgi:acetyl-CoA acyltransferase